MKTEAEILDDISRYIASTNLKKQITGDVYTDKRPTNSAKEDIFVHVLKTLPAQIQTALINVRIYVPNLQRQTDSVRNKKRVRELSRLAMDILSSHIQDGWYIVMEEQSVEESVDNRQHVIINRIYYRYCNN